jgi:hypothetical protein
MSPQLNAQQFDHAISVFEKRVEAKKLEIGALAKLCERAPDVVADLTMKGELLRQPIEDFFTARHTVATLELEDLQLQLAAMRQMRSGVVGVNRVIPPFNSHRQ